MMRRSSSSTRFVRWIAVAAWFGLFAGAVSCAAAQTADSVAQLTCEQASGVARGRSHAASRKEGVAILGRCPREFGEVIPELWRDGTLSSTEAGQLKWTTRGIRDRRVFAALMEAARNKSNGVDVRLEAIAILATYVEGTFALSEDALRRARPGDLMLRTAHGEPRAGDQPTGQAEVSQVIGLFVDLAENGSPAELKNAGAYLRQGLVAQYASLMPLPSGAVTGTWDCNGHLMLENRGTYDVPLVVVDSAGTKFLELSLAAPGGGASRPNKVTPQYRRTGPVTVQFGGRTLLRFSCP